jgi:hypothetical protein
MIVINTELNKTKEQNLTLVESPLEHPTLNFGHGNLPKN